MGNNVLFKAVNQVNSRKINKYKIKLPEDKYFSLLAEVTTVKSYILLSLACFFLNNRFCKYFKNTLS